MKTRSSLQLARNFSHRVSLVCALGCLTFGVAFAAPEHWADEIAQLTAADTPGHPAKGGVVFVGSSSIKLWKTLAQDFPNVPTLNRGFGGSELADSVFYFEKIVAPYQPRTVVLYAGENDLTSGKAPEKLAAEFVEFQTKVRTQLPKTRLIFISIKPSPSRALHHAAFKKANALIAAQCARDPLSTFVDVASSMYTPDGSPNEALFGADRLHMNAEGYALWTKILTPILGD